MPLIAAAEDAPARVVDRTAVEAGLGLGLEAPVGARVVFGFEVADRHADPEIIVVAAGLEQQHAPRRIGREPVREQAPRGAGADDDVVEAPHEFGCCPRHRSLGPVPRTAPIPWHASAAASTRSPPFFPTPADAQCRHGSA
jgi:hypothetical protein